MTTSVGTPPVIDALVLHPARRQRVLRVPRWGARILERFRYDGVGLTFAVLFVCWSLTPSLLPRGPAFQGWLSGIVSVLGYGLGVLLSRGVGWVGRSRPTALRWSASRPSRAMRRAGVLVVLVGGVASIGVFLVAARRWQREAHELVGQESPGAASPLLIVALLVGVFVSVVGAVRGARLLVRWVSRRLSRRVPEAVASLGSVVLVVMVAWTVADQVVMRTMVTLVDQTFSATNAGTRAGVRQPESPLRSGSSASLVRWRDLGLQGRSFVAGAPAVAQLSEFAGRPAKEPIRVYVGVESADTVEQRARTAVAELERTGAFDRGVLCVVTTTGTGWVDAQAARALEFLHAGDTAIVTTQYSYLPSALSFVLDDHGAERAGRELFRQVHARWSAMPANQRPRLLVFGESLGSNGGQAAFPDPGAFHGRADAALFVGPPDSNELWRGIVDDRDPGSTERLPRYDDGTTVRFADDVDDVKHFDEPWNTPRVLFLQHASDPIVWWTPDLLFKRPDWLREPRGDDVSRSMNWYPVVTFWQVTADLVAANDVPPGSGHRYDDLIGDAWAAVAPPTGWTDADSERLRRTLAATDN